MCVVSMIYDHYHDEWGRRRPGTGQWPVEPVLPYVPPQSPPPTPEDLQRELRRLLPKPPAITPQEIEEFRRLLDRAREYDKRNNEPDCELEPKRQQLRDLAKELGVEIAFL